MSRGRCRAIPLPYRDLTRLRLLIREYLRCVAPLDELLLWVDRLTGIDRDRALSAVAEIQRWNLRAVAERLATPRNLDDVVRCVLLAEDVTSLVDKGSSATS